MDGGSSFDDVDDELHGNTFEMREFGLSSQDEAPRATELDASAAPWASVYCDEWAISGTEDTSARSSTPSPFALFDPQQLISESDALETGGPSSAPPAPPQLALPALKRHRGKGPLMSGEPDAGGASNVVAASCGHLSFEQAEQLLQSDSLGCAGGRPDYLAVVGCWASLGTVYKDAVERRRRGIDRWQCKYGQGSTTVATADGEHIVRRSHGKVKVVQRAARDSGGAAKRPLPHVLKFHQYTLEVPPPRVAPSGGSGASGEGHHKRTLVTTQKLFHLLGAQEQDEYDSTEKAAATTLGAPPSKGSSVHKFEGTLQMTNPQHQKGTRREIQTWMSFHRGGQKGDQEWRGAIIDGEHGAQFASACGDFAEYHRRCPGEDPFVEGDVVGLNSAGMLTRQTSGNNGVWQLGVITRRAAVTGSEPPRTANRSDFDTIAYTGRVVVRLLGGCNTGDYIVPSGRQDGTARGATATVRPTRTVGRALNRCDPNQGDMSESLVEISVIGPSDSVDTRRQRCALSGAEHRRAVLLLILLLSCVVLPVGLTFAHLRASDWETDTTYLRASDEESTVAGVRCQAVTVSALGHGLCRHCSGRDATVKFAPMEAGTARLPCPDTHTGSMIRTCGGIGYGHSAVSSADGDVDDAGSAVLSDGSTVSGTCTRKVCPRQTFPLLPPIVLQQYPSHVEPLCMKNGLCQIQLDATPEGTGSVTIPCPTKEGSPFWPGNFTRVCGTATDQWQRPAAGTDTRSAVAAVAAADESTTGDCEWRTCPSGCLSLTRSSNGAPFDAAFHAGVSGEACPTLTRELQVSVPVPQWSIGQLRTVHCCKELTASGSCADPSAGLGSVEVSCGEDGVWRYTRGGCEPPSSLQLAMGHPSLYSTASHGLAAAQSAALQDHEMLWNNFARGPGRVASKASGGRWLMPAIGRLGRLYISWRGGDWQHLSTLQQFHSGISTAIGLDEGVDGIITIIHGWGIAALAKVSCRQLGLGPAYLATNCKGLRGLVARNGGFNATDLEAVCPSSVTSASSRCPQLLGDTDERGRNGNGLFSVNGWYDQPSLCTGNETNVGQCFRYELAQRNFPPSAKVTVGCDHQIVVACSSVPRQTAAEQHEQGVWVVGDDIKHHSEHASEPSILTGTDYREGCALRDVHSVACWGAELPRIT